MFPISHTESMKVTVLGSGTSQGIPVVGCSCPVCFSPDERDKRMRASVFIEGFSGENLLIDAGPEFRLQALRAGIKHIDGIFLTHAHADHLHGLDDVRPLSWENPIPVYANEQTIMEMKERFSYVWKETQVGGGKPKITPKVLNEPLKIGNLEITPVPVKHGCLDILGWEVSEKNNSGEKFLYLTDTSFIPDSSKKQLENQNCSRVIIIGGLRIRPHKTHFCFEEALDAVQNLKAKEVYLTHICHSHSFKEIDDFCQNYREKRELKKMEIHPAWDGLELTI